MKRYDEVTSTDEPGADTAFLPQYAMQDTVGAVAWDAEGNMAAGVSRSAERCSSTFVDTTDVCDSGGLLLKYSGRIGEVRLSSRKDDGVADRPQATTFGTGCWAEQSQDGQAGIACSISGTNHRTNHDSMHHEEIRSWRAYYENWTGSRHR